MTSFSYILNTQDPSCCNRKKSRVTLEINLLENGIYALYLLVMLGTFCLFNNTKGIYVCVTFLVCIMGNIYSINYSINQKIHEGHDNEIDIGAGPESDESTEEESEHTDPIIGDFKRVVNEAADESEAVETIQRTAAAEYERLSKEYTRIEKIIQSIAAEYRQKASHAKEAAQAAEAVAEYDSEAEARGNAADQREYNED